MRMKLSLRIPLIITMIIFMTGVAMIINRGARSVPLPTNFFAIWLVPSIIMIGITVWSWLHFKDK